MLPEVTPDERKPAIRSLHKQDCRHSCSGVAGDTIVHHTDRMNDLLSEASARAIRYLDTLATRNVAPDAAAIDALRAFDEPFPDSPTDPAATLRLLDDVGSPAPSMAMAGPRFFGFVIGGSLPVALGANWLAGAWDQNSALYRATPGTAFIEQIALRWLLDVLRLPPECAGAFVTGATVANLCALAAARHAVLQRAGWNVEADGLFGAPPITVIVGAEAHPSVTKSLGILGLGRTRVVKVPVDAQGRMLAEKLPPISGPTIVCVQAGNVNTGAFDPSAEICRRAHAAGAWVHVDGAFGLWAAAAPTRAALATGIELADSWATDAHKWLNVPYDCGPRVCARWTHAAGRDGDHGGIPTDAERVSQPRGLRARAFAPGARRRGVGCAARARPRRRGGAGRAKLRAGAALRRETVGGGL